MIMSLQGKYFTPKLFILCIVKLFGNGVCMFVDYSIITSDMKVHVCQ